MLAQYTMVPLRVACFVVGSILVLYALRPVRVCVIVLSLLSLTANWKLRQVQLHPKVVSTWRALLTATFNDPNLPEFSHPFGPFADMLAYIDRVCYRFPDSVLAEGGLGLHLDRNPLDPYLAAAGGLTRWRPIQGFVCLTDHFDAESGGLRVVRGFHTRIERYFAQSPDTSMVGQAGEFFRMQDKSHAKLARQCSFVYAPRGSLVLWDNRLPHDTCQRLSGFDTREVVYTAFLPDVAVNQRYCETQFERLRDNTPPPFAQAAMQRATQCDRDWDVAELTPDQTRLLGGGVLAGDPVEGRAAGDEKRPRQHRRLGPGHPRPSARAPSSQKESSPATLHHRSLAR
jgi:hypothetical protein